DLAVLEGGGGGRHAPILPHPLAAQSRNDQSSTATQMSSMPVALTNRLRPKSRARMWKAIATMKYATRHAVVSTPRYGIQMPASRPAPAAIFSHASMRHHRFGKRTSSQHRAMNATGPQLIAASNRLIAASTT